MNQGKIWRVVNPTVGVPLFLGAVALTSLFVHYQLLTRTAWLPAYYQGGAKAVKAVRWRRPPPQPRRLRLLQSRRESHPARV